MEIRYETFLMLCRLMNYHKTAEALHITQPAVTKQIQSLEAEFQTKFFLYDHHKLYKTPEAEVLENYIISMRHNYDNLKKELEKKKYRTIRIGATKTIGDYVIPEALDKYLSDETHNISIDIDNTEALLSKMRESKLDFAIVEGIFDKKLYSSRLLRKESFTGICCKGHRFAGKTVDFKDLFSETLIVRERGSGTRNILERGLTSCGYSFKMFRRCCEISSIQLINMLVAKGIGISFAYKSVIAGSNDIEIFKVKGFEISHEFNVVWLKYTSIPEEGENLLNMIHDRYVE